MMGLVGSRLYHPATGQLLRSQTTGMLRRLTTALKSPRKRFLSLVAIILGVVWLSQATASILFREAADPEAIKLWIPLGLFLYTCWHLFRLATRPVEAPFSWTPAEKEFVLAAPLTQQQQITYRMLSVASAAFVKASCFCLLMLPDLPNWWCGFIGMLLGLSFVDLIRVTAELFVYSLNRKGLLVFRALVIGAALTVGLIALVRCLLSTAASSELASPGALEFFRHMYREVIVVAQSSVGDWLTAPFRVFATVTLSGPGSPGWWMALAGGAVMVTAMLACVYGVDQWMRNQVAQRELAQLSVVRKRQTQSARFSKVAPQRWVPLRFYGVGSLAWRQLLGARNYWQSVSIAMVLPIFLSCLPLVAQHDPSTMLLHIVGASLFYSFLLLPSALILDFRRDINRMPVLKSLPLAPLGIVLGQLAAPVAICWSFQASVLLIAAAAGKVVFWQAALAWVLMLPATVLIFAIENYIFLLSPFKRNKEGFDVFLRTILTFTGKCVGFVLGGTILLGVYLIVVVATSAIGLPPIGIAAMGYAALWIVVSMTSLAMLMLIARQFTRFDVSQDLPGMG